MPRFGNPGVRHDLYIKQGCTFDVPFVCTEGGMAPGIPIDLTGADVRAQIRSVPSSTVIAATFLVAIVNPEAGQGLLRLTAEQTASIPAGDSPSSRESQYNWDAEVEFPDGTVRPLAWGKVTIHPEVTK